MSTFVKGGGGAVENLEVPLTDLETTLQQVLDILPFKGFQNSGQYVWKKYEGYIVNLTQTTTGSNPTSFRVDGRIIGNGNTDFSNVSCIVGLRFKDSFNHILEFLTETTVRHCNTDGTTKDYTFTWDSANSIIRIPVSWGQAHVFTEQKVFDVVDFVVSNDAEAYPNGAVHTDGYWYELVGEGFDFEKIFNITQTAVNTYTPSSDIASSSAAIPHSLGVIPKVAIIYGYPSRLAGNLEQAVAFYPTSGTGCSILTRQEGSGYTMANGSTSDTKATSSTVKFSHGNIWFKAGVEYTLITMV